MVKLTKKYIKRQIKYFTKQWKVASEFADKQDYSKRIFFWETELGKL